MAARDGHASRLRRRWAGAVVALVSPVALLAAGHTGDGELDLSFGSGGTVLSDVGVFPTEVIVGPRRSLVVTGGDEVAPPGGGDFVVARFTPAGTLDPSFGTGGLASVDFGGLEIADDVARQPDGKLVVTGTVFVPDPADPPSRTLVGLARFNADGSVDPSFGDGGIVLSDLAFDSSGRELVVQRDGRIVVLVSTLVSNVGPQVTAVARYLPDGSLDSSFGGDGVVVPALPGVTDVEGTSLTVRPGGAITVAGSGSLDMLVFRLDRSGDLDPSFGTGGFVTVDGQGIADQALSLAELPDGGLVAAGFAGDDGGDTADLMVARFRRDGSPDPEFGGAGVVTTDVGGRSSIAYEVVAQPTGTVTAVGSGGSAGGDVLLARYRRDGSLDPTFGDGGLVVTDIAGQFDTARAAVQQSPRRLVVAGASQPGPPGQTFFLLLAGYRT